MSTETTAAPVAVETTAAAKKVPAKAPGTKAGPAKSNGKPAARPIVRGEMTADGRRKTLRNPQITILLALSKAKENSLTRKEIADKCPNISLSEHLGTIDGSKNKWTVSLVEHKFVKQGVFDLKGKDTMVYTLTATGKKEVEKLK